MSLDFEKQALTLESKIKELKHLSNDSSINIADEIAKMQKKAAKLLTDTYKNLTPWQKVQIARHPDRPKAVDYIQSLFTDFEELAGDRLYGNDRAIVAGVAKFHGLPIMVIGQQKGKNTEERIRHNFGMPRPEGYRKSQRLMMLADRFQLPIVVLIDTPGASPGVEAEERGQSEAIAKAIEVSLNVSTPLIAVITGEGCSGGAIAIGAANYVMMLEHATYSVISPEGCASILWRSAEKASDAAVQQKLTSKDLLALKIIDEIITEPIGGAHRYPQETIHNVNASLSRCLREAASKRDFDWRQHRLDKFLYMTEQL